MQYVASADITMKLTICSAICILAILNLQESSAATDKVVCYYGSWSTYRNGEGKFDVENINPHLCTHVVYTFVGLSADGTIRILDEYNDLEENWGKGSYKRLNKLKEINPNLKTIIAIGGWNEGSVTYSSVMANDNFRAKFVQNVVEFVTKHGFDGFDLDWEYPAQRGGAPYDVQSFTKVLRDLRAAFDQRGLILSAAVASADFSVSQSYDVPELSKYLDIINVMTYDLHGPWDKYTGLHTGLYPSSSDVTEIEKQLNVAACIETWIRKGADPAKINLGLAFYGKTYTLDNPSNTGLKSVATYPGRGGHYTYQDGMLGYNEIVELQQAGGWTKVWDNEQKVPYMFKGNQWCSYDDPESIRLKVEYAKSKGLGGVLLWSIETDDFHGVSGTKFALLETINKALGKNNTGWTPTTQKPNTPSEPTTQAPTGSTAGSTAGSTTGSTTSTTANPGIVTPDKLCKNEGYMRDPTNCSIFYYCIPDAGGYRAYEYKCGDELVFDTTINVCNYRWNTNC